jgi:hypothetical protein
LIKGFSSIAGGGDMEQRAKPEPRRSGINDLAIRPTPNTVFPDFFLD